MALLSVTAITSEAVVSCSSAASNAPQRIKAHASTIANSPKSRAISSAKAMKRSPSRAKRYRTAGSRVEAAVAVVRETAGAGSVNPHSSRRCWPAGIAPPQRLQCFECELIWLWQCGHCILCEGPHTVSSSGYAWMGGPLRNRRTAVKRPLSGWGVRIHCLSFQELICRYCCRLTFRTHHRGHRGPQRKSKSRPCLAFDRRDRAGAPFLSNYCAGVCGAAGVGASAATSGVIGLIFTVERICSRRLKTLSRSTCLTSPSAEASVVTFRANS